MTMQDRTVDQYGPMNLSWTEHLLTAACIIRQSYVDFVNEVLRLYQVATL